MVEVGDQRPPAVTAGGLDGEMHQRHGVRPTGDRENQRGPVSHAESQKGGLEAGGERRHRLGQGGPGSGGRIRTTDQGLMSPLLYH